jgi:hypothetical protein
MSARSGSAPGGRAPANAPAWSPESGRRGTEGKSSSPHNHEKKAPEREPSFFPRNGEEDLNRSRAVSWIALAITFIQYLAVQNAKHLVRMRGKASMDSVVRESAPDNQLPTGKRPERAHGRRQRLRRPGSVRQDSEVRESARVNQLHIGKRPGGTHVERWKASPLRRTIKGPTKNRSWSAFSF